MAQDLRELFKKHNREMKPSLKEGHQERFLKRLEKADLPRKKSNFPILKVAASILALVSLATLIYRNGNNDPIKTTLVDKGRITPNYKTISLGNLSPELRKIENYYEANINMELSQLEISKSNKTMVNSYMDQLTTLNEEYKKLTTELNVIGPNDQTITALIKNLQLRLQLLHRLKEKLTELKSMKNKTTSSGKTNSI